MTEAIAPEANEDPAWWQRSPGWLPQAVSSRSAQRWWLRGVIALLVVALGACLAVGANRPANPRLLSTEAMVGLAGHSRPTSSVAGFGQIGFRVISARRSALGPARCALYADTDVSRDQGMMGRTNLAGYDAMIFRFFTDSTAAFYNQDVPIPLSIAWFDNAGVLVGTAVLAVCSANCPTLAPSLPYRLALEVPEGGLRHLGIGAGSVLLVGGNCGS